MDLKEQKQRVDEARAAVEAKQAAFLKADSRHSNLEDELRAEYGPDPYEGEPDFYDEYESTAEQAERALADRERAKKALDAATTKFNEEDAKYQIERSSKIIREADEERAGAVHWDRRFHTSLAIGHGAAFAAIVAHAFDHDTAQLAIKLSLVPLACFGIGLLTGGAIPLLLARRGDPTDSQGTLELAEKARRDGRAMAMISAGFFVVGLLASYAGVAGMAFQPSPAPTVAHK